MRLTEAKSCLSDRFEEKLKPKPRQAIRMEKPLETACVGPKVGLGGLGVGIARVGQTV